MPNSRKRKFTLRYDLRSKCTFVRHESAETHTIDGFIKQFRKTDPSKKLFLYQYNTRHKVTSPHASKIEFIDKIKQSIHLLKTKAPKYYALFCLYNKTIVAGLSDISYANFTRGIIEIGVLDLERGSAEWLAGLIIHETIHFWQSGSGLFDIKTEQSLELEAIKHSIDVIRLLNGSEDELVQLQMQRGTHYSQPGYKYNIKTM